MAARDRSEGRSDTRVGLALGILAAVLTILAVQPVGTNIAATRTGAYSHSSHSR
jgi:hypothetical protein